MMPQRDLSSSMGQEAIRRVVAEQCLLAFDFDGTLAALVDDPTTATMSDEVYSDLAALAVCRPVAVITGRARQDVLQRLPSGIAYVVGNHGCEFPDGDPLVLTQASKIATHWRSILTDMIVGTGLRLECKQLSLALHWRGHHAGAASAELAAHFAMCLTPRPQLVEGDHVLNLLPPGLPDKGVALLRLMEITGCQGALFVGDDITDAAVFRLRDPGILDIEVGNKTLGASWRVADTQAVAQLIHTLASLAKLY